MTSLSGSNMYQYCNCSMNIIFVWIWRCCECDELFQRYIMFITVRGRHGILKYILFRCTKGERFMTNWHLSHRFQCSSSSFIVVLVDSVHLTMRLKYFRLNYPGCVMWYLTRNLVIIMRWYDKLKCPVQQTETKIVEHSRSPSVKLNRKFYFFNNYARLDVLNRPEWKSFLMTFL